MVHNVKTTTTQIQFYPTIADETIVPYIQATLFRRSLVAKDAPNAGAIVKCSCCASVTEQRSQDIFALWSGRYEYILKSRTTLACLFTIGQLRLQSKQITRLESNVAVRDEYIPRAVAAVDDGATPSLHGYRAALCAVPLGHDRFVVGAVREADGVTSLREAHGFVNSKLTTRWINVVGCGSCAEQQVVERAQQQHQARSVVDAVHGWRLLVDVVTAPYLQQKSDGGTHVAATICQAIEKANRLHTSGVRLYSNVGGKDPQWLCMVHVMCKVMYVCLVRC